jgi:hypothetical protein
MPMRPRAALAGLFAGLLLVACGRAPVQITDLRLPQAAFAGVVKVDDKSVVQRVDALDTLPARDQAVMQTLAAQKIAGTGYWRDWVGEGQARGVYKVRTTLFDDVAAREAGWSRRYSPQSLEGSESLALGDGGFIYQNRIAGFRHGRMMVEIGAEGQAPQLRAFTETYSRFVAESLGR